MSNYTQANLVSVNPADVPAGSLAMKVGNLVFVNANAVPQKTSFYKCASVDTTNHTWTGYKAVLTDGSYIFEVTATTGLTYGGAYTPSVGGIYDDGASIKVERMFDDIPDIGLVFYAPLSNNSEKAVTGQDITYEYNPQFTTQAGIPCMYCPSGDPYALAYVPNIPQGAAARSISFWGYARAYVSDWMAFLSYGADEDNKYCGVRTNNNKAGFGFCRNDHDSGVSVDGAWHHFAFVYTGTAAQLFVDAVKVLDVTTSINTTGTTLGIGKGVNIYTGLRGYIAAVRIYNRVLTASEITALAREFTPTGA